MAWTKQDQKRAQRQGWMLASASFLGADRITIQRVDDPRSAGLRYEAPRFIDDRQAEAYVRGRSDAGCALAKKALRESNHVFRIVGRISDWNDLGPSLKREGIKA